MKLHTLLSTLSSANEGKYNQNGGALNFHQITEKEFLVFLIFGQRLDYSQLVNLIGLTDDGGINEL